MILLYIRLLYKRFSVYCVLVWAPHIKTELLCWCQWEVWGNLNPRSYITEIAVKHTWTATLWLHAKYYLRFSHGLTVQLNILRLLQNAMQLICWSLCLISGFWRDPRGTWSKWRARHQDHGQAQVSNPNLIWTITKFSITVCTYWDRLNNFSKVVWLAPYAQRESRNEGKVF